jgi:hypothetical protein
MVTTFEPTAAVVIIAAMVTPALLIPQGFNVQIVLDACGGLSVQTDDAALRRLVHAGVVTTSIPSLAGQLAGDFTQPKGMQALGIFYEMALP